MGLGENKPANLADFAAILSWYGDMGVTDAVFESPQNWLQPDKTIDNSLLEALHNQLKPASFKAEKSGTGQSRGNGAPPPLEKPASPRPRAPAAPPPAVRTTIEEATKIAAACQSLGDLKDALTEFNGCALKRTAKNLVFMRGSESAKLMIIGDAPGRDEDIVGKPFVGRAGAMLDRMLAAIDIDPDETHITNIVYWRPPGNRTPTPEESAHCRPFLDRQIELVAPKLILLLGGAAAKQLYETETGITKLRGKWQNLPGDKHKMQTMATLHPAYLLRTPIAKRMAWQDLQMIREKLES